ncbi:MAG TPA: recombinase family protein [Bryobacteraceae bacterium]|jgi:DNA invertase Pin-like site-specific DNA recombinase|nr:recombinase family protein [Bryobacteraceae bacterium]
METTQHRAAEYMRMSTEHQQYSIANQSVIIQEYANARSIEIVRSYVDRGKSGLALEGRPGLQSLLQTVTSGNADFTLLLIYDVSRWGRFQDVDESAYYEYTLKKAGVRIIYCAEPFLDTGSPTDALIKTLKRAMAAEYSRELSAKVSQGNQRIAQLGYRLGGLAGLGLRRAAVDPSGSRRIVLQDGERKGVKTDRITLIHGPREEVRTIRKIFKLFVDDGYAEKTIAAYLNERRILTKAGNAWSRETIRQILTNPKYAGDLAYNRTVTRMGSSPITNPREKWTYLPDRFRPIISRDTWDRAQTICKTRMAYLDEDEMLARLRALLSKHGRLSYELIDAEPGMPAAQTYQKRFGSINEAYRRIGWNGRNYKRYAKRSEARSRKKALEDAITSRITAVADYFTKDNKMPRWTVNGEISMYVAVAAARIWEKKKMVWKFNRRYHNNQPIDSDLLVIARLNAEATSILDYYVFPGIHAMPIRIFERNPWSLDIHRFEDLSFLDLLCCRTKLVDPGEANV